MKNITRYRLELVKEQTARYECPNQLISPSDVAKLLNDIFMLNRATEEKMVMVCLDVKCRPIGVFEISVGNLSSSIVHPREIFKRAILANAYSIIIAHNHPSNDGTASNEDILITKRINEAGKLMGINLLDHLIITYDSHYSLKEQGYL